MEIDVNIYGYEPQYRWGATSKHCFHSYRATDHTSEQKTYHDNTTRALVSYLESGGKLYAKFKKKEIDSIPDSLVLFKIVGSDPLKYKDFQSSYVKSRNYYIDLGYLIRSLALFGSDTQIRIGIEQRIEKPISMTITTDGSFLNKKPSISGKDEHLGAITDAITKKYTVSDPDGDRLSIVVKLNNNIIDTASNVASETTKEVKISKEDIYKLPLNKTNTIEISVSDGQETVYRKWTFIRTNTAPIINLETEQNLGDITISPTIKFNIDDIEKDKINLKVNLMEDDKIIKEILSLEDVELDKSIETTIKEKDWVEILLGNYKIVIVAIDSQGGENTATTTFTKVENMIKYTTNPVKTKDETDNNKNLMAQILLHFILFGDNKPSKLKVEACNNAFDDEPTWEDITNATVKLSPYTFTNKEKTHKNWGVSIRVEAGGGE